MDCGLYADQVERYLDRFGAQVHVAFFEEFVGDEAGTIARVHSFLGLEGATPSESRQKNPGSMPRNRLSAALLASGRVRTLARATFPRRLRSGLRAALLVRPPGRPWTPRREPC